MYSGRFPPGIQIDTSWKGVIVTPRRGKAFWCVKRPHITASWQKAYESH